MSGIRSGHSTTNERRPISAGCQRIFSITLSRPGGISERSRNFDPANMNLPPTSVHTKAENGRWMQNRISCAAKNFGGKIEEGIRSTVGDTKTEAEGAINRMTGAAQNAYAQMKDVAGQAVRSRRRCSPLATKFLRWNGQFVKCSTGWHGARGYIRFGARCPVPSVSSGLFTIGVRRAGAQSSLSASLIKYLGLFKNAIDDR